MPDATRGATLGQLYNWIRNGGSFGRKPSFVEIIEKGWGPALQAGILYWDTTNEDLRADANFQMQTVEENSSSIESEVSVTRKLTDSQLAQARLKSFSLNASAIDGLAAKRIEIDETLGAGGTLAATQLVPAVSGKGIYVEEVSIDLEPVTDNIQAFGGLSAVITLQDDAGTPVRVAEGVVSHVKQNWTARMCEVTGDTQDLDIVVTAGIAGHVGASKLHGYVLYREI